MVKMFCVCPDCQGRLLTVAPDGFNMIRCKCECGWVDEFELKRSIDDLWELIDDKYYPVSMEVY